MIVHKYIVHVLDRNSEGPILNDFEGKNNMEVDKFFEKVINKVTKDDDLRQAVFKDYNETNVKLIIAEMVDVLTARMRASGKESRVIGFGIGYSKDVHGGFYHSIKLDTPTDSSKEITNICFLIFDRYYNNLPIRKVSISCGGLTKKSGVQLNLFDSIEEKNNEVKVNTAIDEIKARFGKNSIVKASSLLPDSTAIERNKKIGGHHE